MAPHEAPARSAHPLLQATGISLQYGHRMVLQNVDFQVAGSEIVTIIGPNGAGKSCLARILLGLEAPSAGTVFRSPGLKLGYMPQYLTVDRALPMTAARFLSLGGRQPIETLQTVLSEVGLGDILSRSFHDLSGGERQRLMLARALLCYPDLLVLDEPLAHVDLAGQVDLYRLIGDIRTARGCSILMISHDLHFVMEATDQVYCIDGHVCCHGPPDQVSQTSEYLALLGPLADAPVALYRHRHIDHHLIPHRNDGDPD